MQPPLFHRVLDDDWGRIPAAIVAVHDIGDGKVWHGAATVTAGSSLLARLVRALAGFPPSAEIVPLTVEMTPNAGGEIWRRRFGDHLLTSRLGPGRAPGTVKETLSAVTVSMRLVPDERGVQQVTESVHLLGVPLPRLLWPALDVREGADGDQYLFRVAMHLWGALLLRYEGYLQT